MTVKDIFEEAFFLGFMCSREGWNGECSYDHCADNRIAPKYIDEKEFRKEMKKCETFRGLRDEAFKRIFLQ